MLPSCAFLFFFLDRHHRADDEDFKPEPVSESEDDTEPSLVVEDELSQAEDAVDDDNDDDDNDDEDGPHVSRKRKKPSGRAAQKNGAASKSQPGLLFHVVHFLQTLY